jgi:acyl dehydratase
MPVVVGQKAKVFHLLGRLDWTKVVHAEQSIELLRAVPVAGEIETTARITGIFDKGKHAIAEITFDSRSATNGQMWFRTTMTLMLRGSGGWGGDPGQLSDWTRPDRTPDHVVTQHTTPEQALLYRLSGDRNRLHSDPAFARKAGFERPILHGLCTYGFVGRALLATACEGDPTRFATMRGRFSAPVLPGEELRTMVWIDGECALFETVGTDGAARLTSGTLELRPAGAA